MGTYRRSCRRVSAESTVGYIKIEESFCRNFGLGHGLRIVSWRVLHSQRVHCNHRAGREPVHRPLSRNSRSQGAGRDERGMPQEPFGRHRPYCYRQARRCLVGPPPGKEDLPVPFQPRDIVVSARRSVPAFPGVCVCGSCRWGRAAGRRSGGSRGGSCRWPGSRGRRLAG